MPSLKQLLITLISASLWASIALMATSSAAQNRLPDIGTVGGGTMSIERERVIGDFYMRQIRASAPVINDPVLDEYLTDLGNRMVQRAKNVRFPFEFFWVNNSEINAFAFLGGKVGIHTGLISEAQTESELASVIAHEISHVTQRHIVRNIERQQQNSPSTVAAIIAGVLMGMANPELGMATMTTAIAGGTQAQINYTRLFEQEADRVGIGILADAGFDPQGAPAFFGRLSSKYRYTSKPPEMLLTHPLSEARVADTRQRADSLPRPKNLDETNFWLAKMRINARYSQTMSETAMRSLLGHSDAAQRQAARYGLAILQLDDGRYAEASETLRPLLTAQPQNPFFLDVQTDILLGQKRFEEAYEMLEYAYIRRPNEQVITLNLANTAVKAGNYETGIAVLRDYLLRKPDNLIALEILYEAYRESGRLASMYETRAEIYGLHGGFKLAIEELHIAHTKTEDDLMKKRLQARIDQFRALQTQVESLN